MARCVRCGADIQADVRFCPSCGQEQNVSAYSEPRYHREDEYRSSSVYEGSFDPQDIEDNRVISVLCYFGLLLLIPLLARPYSQYVRYHANQGILLLLFGIITGAVAIIPILGWIAAIVGGVMNVVFLILGIINSLNGRAKPLPVIGKYTVLR